MEWITTDDVYAETWRRILQYANRDFAVEAISALHGRAVGGQLQNYKKQAEQIRACILQSKEYFDSARMSSSATKFNLSYYGAVSLASAVMLVLGDGRFSLDRLRRDPANKSHGLLFTTNANQDNCQAGLGLLTVSHVEIAQSGFFSRWMSTLPENVPVHTLVKRREGSSGVSNWEVAAGQPVLASNLMVGRKDSLLALLQRIPDLFWDLARCGESPVGSRVNFDLSWEKTRDVWRYTYRFRVHGAITEARLFELLEQFKIPAANCSSLTCHHRDGEAGCIVELKGTDEEMFLFHFPSMRDALNGDCVAYAADLDTHEISDLFRASFGLSMLSRYFPDLWTRFLESQCMGAVILDMFGDAFNNKFPQLALAHLLRGGIRVSTQKPPWYE